MWTKKKPFQNSVKRPTFLSSSQARGPMGGFTLLEVLIAILIMAMAMGSIIAIQGGAIVATTRSKTMNIVAMLARNQMIEAELKIRGKTFEETKKEDGGTFEAPYQDYRWRMEIKEIKFPQMGNLGTKDSKGVSQMQEMITKLTSSFLSKAIREMSVTVFWKNNSKEQSYTVTTYWVNLNHEFSLTE